MAASIPAGYADLLQFDKKAFANLATLNGDGSPQVTPVWCDFDGTNILLNTARGRVKDRNLRRDPRVALSIPDPANPYRYLAIRGRAVDISEGPAAEAHIDRMAQKYLGKEKYPWRSPNEVRVLVTVVPEKVHGYGS